MMGEKKPTEQWWELVSYFKPEEGKEYRHDGQRVFICGNIGDVTVAQINEVYGNDMATVARIKAAKQILDTVGVEQGLVMTDSVRFVKMRQVVDEATLVQLNEKKQGMTH
jgi:hypothetical protein